MSDLIDRDAFAQRVRDKAKQIIDCGQNEVDVVDMSAELMIMLENAPTVDAEQVRHASWILERDEMRRIYTTCDNCKTCVCFTNYRNGMKVDMRGANYCPNCGAKMDKEEQDG